jgi:hypothetical protein
VNSNQSGAVFCAEELVVRSALGTIEPGIESTALSKWRELIDQQ